ncbi:MAG: peptide chain release factor 1 [Verrucomicrobia bacterium]|nr:peptide chain release factor 1 [Verrucomicrobiota bacterium]
MVSLPDITPFRRRLDELDAQIRSPSFFTNARAAADVTREHQRLGILLADHTALQKTQADLVEMRGLLRDSSGDAGLRELAEAEIPELEKRAEELHATVLRQMIPPEATDSRNTVVEIRAGTGGEEAALFAATLTRMYQRYCETRRWTIEPMGSSPSERGGFREISFLVRGQDVYRQLKFESGVHRVQRVPSTEANGRIHTSTVTVAVLAEAEEVDVHIDPQDLEITVQRASGPGGQGVNTTDSAVRIIHKPTGLMVFCADGRSQIKNKASAMSVLRARLLQRKQDEEQAKYAAQRKTQIGTGDRSERIRTYNFPQSRLTDHRIGLTLHSLAQVIEGAIDPVIEALQKADMERKLAELTGQPYDMKRSASADADDED